MLLREILDYKHVVALKMLLGKILNVIKVQQPNFLNVRR